SYGNPILVDCLVNHTYQRFVLRTVAASEFDHQWRADRANEVIQGYDTFNELAQHARALDIGIVTKNHQLVSIADGDEFFLLTEFIRGTPYANDLQRLRDTGEVTGGDLMRARQLALYLAEIHNVQGDDPTLYTRRIRDTLYSGEGILGLIDSYVQAYYRSPVHAEENIVQSDGQRTNLPKETPKSARMSGLDRLNNRGRTKDITDSERSWALQIVNPEWFKELEKSCVTWRWRLYEKTDRLAQVHGDFHPFNVLFERNGTFHTIGRSRGAWGEPADDVACMAINYLFFSLQRSGTLASPFEQLWNIFWNTYIGSRNDPELLVIIGPFFAWRALVLASPIWYNVADEVRTTLLNFARYTLQAELFDPAAVKDYLSTERK
ncbi:MAG: phosphotransferase, partial [Caldilineaceae bacterium]|nr:phosphotransferase [Caldilineaceae bacterium]